ncbi:MAG: SufD family Fe-S cluster assembly protein [Candidatus Altiarchaeota archaeon]|nr:SufD family Fe-S cluster assembly protein [Candidatus Altiarchaeota archaeon]
MDGVEELYRLSKLDKALEDPNVGHIVINLNKILDKRLIPGLEIDARELEDGIDARITVREGTVIEKPVHLCFGVTHEKAVQRIKTEVEIQENAEVLFLAHCIFPNAVDVTHIMDARITVGENAKYTYLEKHIHGEYGGTKVYPKARVELGKNSRFKTEFELLSGRVGLIEIDYETVCREESVMEMTSKVSGRGNDIIRISEVGHLVGEHARGVLTSRVAVRENAKAEVHNKLNATAAYARGHVDCKEIIQDNGIATAIPIVQVSHPKAHITHEASIGSVDTKQLETLMARGLTEDEAVELIIEGLLS